MRETTRGRVSSGLLEREEIRGLIRSWSRRIQGSKARFGVVMLLTGGHGLEPSNKKPRRS